MAVESPGAFLQAGSYGAEQTRRAIYALLERGGSIGSVAGGLIGATDCQITPGSGLHVEVAPGELVIPGSSSATQSGYYGRVSSTSSLVIAAANETNPRIDRVSAIIKDAAYSGAENTFTVAVETGTPEAGATLNNLKGVAAAPASSVTLGYVLVPAKAVSISGGNISNIAGLLALGLQSATYREGAAAARPAAGVKGRIYFATDSKIYSIDNGSEWIELAQEKVSLSNIAGLKQGEEYEPSATKPCLVVVSAVGNAAEVQVAEVQILGKKVGYVGTSGIGHAASCTFKLGFGQKFKLVKVTGAAHPEYPLFLRIG